MNLDKLGYRKSLYVIIVAAVLMELISASQYYYTHDLLEDELETRAESELVMKGALTKNMLNMAEVVLKDHLWDIRQSLAHPDSVYSSIKRIGMSNAHLRGGFMAFVPDYYSRRDSLFEVYARKTDGGVDMLQIAGPQHDYTERLFYKMALRNDKPIWVDPYDDNEGAQELVTTFAMSVNDLKGRLAGVAGVDISLKWLSDTLDKRHIYPSSFNVMLTEDGRMFLGSKRDVVSRKTIEQVARLINDSTTSRVKSSSGRSTIIDFEDNEGKSGSIFYANLKGYPHWQVAVVCYDNEVYGRLYDLRLKLFVLMLAGFLLLGYIVWRNIRSMSRLRAADGERERISNELHIAQSIQMEMLPKKFPAFPEREDIDIFGNIEPAWEVGGDLFDFLLRDEKLFFCIGDVSGKGVPAALGMAVVHSQFCMVAAHENNPARIVQTLNTSTCEGNESNLFVTFFVGVLDLPTGRFRYCNAGHDAPFIRKDDGSWQKLDVKSHIPIALFNDFQYTMQEVDLSDGAVLFLYTDGLTEAQNEQHQQMGLERVVKALRKCDMLKAEKIVRSMVDSAHKFAGGAEQSDDLTMMAICYTPNADESTFSDKLVLTNKVSEVKRLNAFIKSVTDRLGLKPSLAGNIKLAVEEAVVNVIDYAYLPGVEGEVTVEADSNGKRLKIVISDAGTAFDPTQKARADTTLSAEERPVGGLGILLVRELMDSINYERLNGRNVLTLIKDYTK